VLVSTLPDGVPSVLASHVDTAFYPFHGSPRRCKRTSRVTAVGLPAIVSACTTRPTSVPRLSPERPFATGCLLWSECPRLPKPNAAQQEDFDGIAEILRDKACFGALVKERASRLGYGFDVTDAMREALESKRVRRALEFRIVAYGGIGSISRLQRVDLPRSWPLTLETVASTPPKARAAVPVKRQAVRSLDRLR
jgi:hypothetical protein